MIEWAVVHVVGCNSAKLIMSSTTKWNKESHKPGIFTRPNLIAIADSLWYSSDYDYDNEGMTEYCIKSKQIIQTIPYPSDIKPSHHCCTLVKDIIYIIDGINGLIIAFDPKSKSFTKKQFIPKIGWYPNAVSISDKIRIFYGEDNDKSDLVYDTKNNTVKIHEIQQAKIHAASAASFENKIISIGGREYQNIKCKYSDTVRISQSLNDDNMIKWTLKPQWNLPQTLGLAGCISYKNYILLFGGSDHLTYQDAIYLLDIYGHHQWQKLEHITCPVPGAYVATLTPDNHVHLFLGSNIEDYERHYELPLSTVMGDYYPSVFDLRVLKYVDDRTRSIVYGYFRDQYNKILQIVPDEIIDICLLYFFV